MSNSPLVVYTALSPNRSGTRNHSIDTSIATGLPEVKE